MTCETCTCRIERARKRLQAETLLRLAADLVGPMAMYSMAETVSGADLCARRGHHKHAELDERGLLYDVPCRRGKESK